MDKRQSTYMAMCAAALLVALLISPCLAHGMHVFANAEGATINGRVYFAGGGGAADVTVRALGPNDTVLGRTRTDANGRFSLTATHRCDHRLIAQTPDGHRAEYRLQAEQLPDALPPHAEASPPSHDNVTPQATQPRDRLATPDDLARQITALQHQLERYEHTTRWRDLVGGVGFIVGILGVIAYFKAVRRTTHSR